MTAFPNRHSGDPVARACPSPICCSALASGLQHNVRATGNVQPSECHTDGLLDKVLSFTSVFRYLEDPNLAPILKDLIERSGLPLKSVEYDFAVDSSGFPTSTYHRWFDHKWGREIKES